MESTKKNGNKNGAKNNSASKSKKEETKESRPSTETNSDVKSVKIIYNSKLSTKVNYKKSEQAALTCDWLLKEAIRALQSVSKQKNLEIDFSTFIGLKTKNKNIQLDFWLTQPEKSLTALPQTINLQPVISIPSSTRGRKGQVSQNDFEILSIIAEGGSCSVYIARKKDTGKIYAIKRVGKKALSNFEKTSIAVRRELSVLRKLNSNFIVKLHYTYQTNNYYHFVLDYVPGGDLFFYLHKDKKFPEATAKYYVAEILLALKEIHSQNIIYRDLKPENVLVNIDGHAVLADFGLSKVVCDLKSLHDSHCGTTEYMAPELAARKKYDYTIDFYGLGVVAYELLLGKTPFVCKSTDGGQFAENLQKKEPQIPAKFSPELKDFLNGLLAKDPAKRLGSKVGADEIMSHPWLSDIDFKNLALGQIPAPVNVDTTQLNHVLSELDLDQECELDEENPKTGKSVRNLSEFSFSEEIVKDSAPSVSDETEETRDAFSDDEDESFTAVEQNQCIIESKSVNNAFKLSQGTNKATNKNIKNFSTKGFVQATAAI